MAKPVTTKRLLRNLERLPRRDVLVGFPADDGPGAVGDRPGRNARASSPIKNATLAYIHENGAPEAGIPARPFLLPGIRNGKEEFTKHLKAAARAALAGDDAKVTKHLHAAGIVAADAVRMKLKTGPFVPLAPSTIARRRRRSAGSSYRRKAQSAADVKPLIDTAQMLRAVTHVVR